VNKLIIDLNLLQEQGDISGFYWWHQTQPSESRGLSLHFGVTTIIRKLNKNHHWHYLVNELLRSRSMIYRLVRSLLIIIVYKVF